MINNRPLLKTLTFLLGALFVPSIVSAQSVLDLSSEGHICSFAPDDHLPDELYSFSSSKEADELVASIMSTVGLEPRFTVMAANVPNAAAVIKGEDRLIVYSESWMQKTVSNNSWGAVTLLAHEIAHHLNGHTLEAGGSRPLTELEADKFAGFTVGKLGGTLEDAQWLFRELPGKGSATHPNKSARLEAVAIGWRDATRGGAKVGSRKPAVKEQPSTTNPKITSAEMLNEAVEYVSWLNRVWSLNNRTALPTLSSEYSKNVNFYGNSWSRSRVMQDKKAFAERWPVRAYTFRPDRSASSCFSDGYCTIVGEVDWFAHSPSRGKSSKGTSSWVLGLEWAGDGFLITSEGGKVVARR